ncbi:hypothetical protein SAY87_020575 [Trapa incisa]|uniref:Glycine hydroxymethyltransferase n=1 Tax=Trapa incisa TaxID=236973 RepID=A0AAN7JRK6_9MYRT|nr:hypothetical protein SAY87_020575 [Trapa incisa]
MEFSSVRSDLSLGFNSHEASAASTNSFHIRVGSGFRSSPGVVLMQFLQSSSCRSSVDYEEEVSSEEEEFSILGHSVCLKRQRDGQLLPSSNVAKRAAFNNGVELVTGGTDNHLLLWDVMPFKITGTPAMTSRGCLESDFEMIALFLLRAAQITLAVQREHGNHQKDFFKGLQHNKDILELRNRVEAFASQFTLPGLNCC